MDKTCLWTANDDYDLDALLWEGSCGVVWRIDIGDPNENEMNFCPKCGGKLEVGE